MTPTELVRELIDRYARGDMDGAFELYGDELVFSDEFGVPNRYEIVGKAAFGRSMEEWRRVGGTQTRMYQDISIEDLVIHETKDPNLVIAEWTYVSRIGEETVENRNIIVIGCKDGKIVLSRDYHNYITRAIADGKAAALAQKVASLALPVDRA
ncbi:nuclear transport factor 2 family protein [Rhizobium sp. 2MFCol3.1]|uniref:nuclear transport factor 2 family protein n=1 Tax=Rhizobium sp. 2MFCol3.1 TaxID=1246459 RepID=UPI000364F544|nr:nuclear transport factor 2 family protein [Rhizobium sp. 2MFCol3.1]